MSILQVVVKYNHEKKSNKLVSALRHGRNGVNLSKQRHFEGEDGEITRRMNIKILTDKDPSVCKKVSRKAEATNRDKPRQFVVVKKLTEKVGNQNLWSSLGQSNIGINTGQPLL